MLARIALPTEGRIELHGRAVPLVEVAARLMQLQLTGRKNIYLLAHFFGVSHAIAERHIDDIEELTGLPPGLLDTPTSRYSSSFTRRFAVAAALCFEPDILLVDEFLGSHDPEFGERCLRLIEAGARDRQTVLMVSQDMQLIRRICTDVVWLEQGIVVDRGDPGELARRFAGDGPSSAAASPPARAGDSWKRSFNQHAAVFAAGLFTADGSQIDLLRADQDAEIRIMLEVASAGVAVQCGIKLLSGGVPRVRMQQPGETVIPRRGRYTVTVAIPGGSLPEGSYVARVGAAVREAETASFLIRPNAFAFAVEDDRPPDEADDALEPPEVELDQLMLEDVRWALTHDDAWIRIQ